MFDHVGLKVRNVEASVRFYAAALEPLGYGLCCRDDDSAGFGPTGEPALWLYRATASTHAATHVALRAKDRKAVDRFHAAGAAAGGLENGAPGIRAAYGPTYYAAFLTDPDGNNVEAVCTARARDDA